MKALLIAAALSLGLGSAAATETRGEPVPPTNEAAATGARDALAGKSWSGRFVTKGDKGTTTLALAPSGRGEWTMKEDDRDIVFQMTVTWGVVSAGSAGPLTLVLTPIVPHKEDGFGFPEDEGRLFVLEGTLAGDKLSGVVLGGKSPLTVDLTAQ